MLRRFFRFGPIATGARLRKQRISVQVTGGFAHKSFAEPSHYIILAPLRPYVMPLKQDSRMLAIKTALGPDLLAVRSFTIQEQISRLFQIDAELAAKTARLISTGSSPNQPRSGST